MAKRRRRLASSWTIETYAAHNEALRQAEARFQDERDRRYAEVALEREKAVRIKEVADERALQLASEIQAYKDEKANELRSQIEGERGAYVTRLEFKPIADQVIANSGRLSGTSATWGQVVAIVTLGLGAATVVISVVLVVTHH